MAADASTTIGSRPSAPAVAGAIRQAAQTTGVNFEHLLATAKVESNLDPNLTMRSSTATGLFQFLEQTWLGIIKDVGGALGFGRYADAIQQTSSGRYGVADPALRQEIMQLRKDPKANAVMGGAITRQNAATLAKRIGRAPTDGELYVAHFFGPYAASKVVKLAGAKSQANAAEMFPAAARANKPIFYDRQGNARSVTGVYAELVRRYQVARASSAPAATLQVAALEPARSAQPLLAGAEAATASTSDSAGSQPLPFQFRSLFQSEEPRGAVAPLVAQLWTAPEDAGDRDSPAAATSTASATSAGPAASAKAAPAAAPFDLFRNTRSSARALFDGSA
jgi:hypothetical protein